MANCYVGFRDGRCAAPDILERPEEFDGWVALYDRTESSRRS